MRLLIFGLGYVGSAVAAAAMRDGADVTGTARSPIPVIPVTPVIPAKAGIHGPTPVFGNGPVDSRFRGNDDYAGTGLRGNDGLSVDVISPESVLDALSRATHLLVTAPPDEHGDPLIARAGLPALAAASSLRWIGYLSTTGVYGDRQGGWVDETTPPRPVSDRAARRLAAEAEFSSLGDGRAVDLFRIAGIYGPGRSAVDDLRANRSRRVVRSGHVFGRIHRDDIVRAVLAAMRQDRSSGVRILNLADDEPAASADVIVEAARLIGVAPPPERPFEAAWEIMSPMARSFWAENRRVSSRATQEQLGLRWLYPSYREGLRAILDEERGEDIAQESEIGRA